MTTNTYDDRPMAEILAEQENKYYVTADKELDHLLSQLTRTEATVWGNVVEKAARGIKRQWNHGQLTDEQYDAAYHKLELEYARTMMQGKEK